MEYVEEVEDLSYRYIVGIDLGTTNSAVAYVDRADKGDPRRIRFLDIPQLVESGQVSQRPVLPSFLYLPGTYELPEGSTKLPWDARRPYAVGEFAREQGALVPGRMVSSAKSWLCHGGVDRTAPILPWGAGGDVEKASPVDAGAMYLRHIREAWNDVVARGREGYLLEEQFIVLTVPASFDEVARELTVTAARRAGMTRVVLVEEPLAAFYAWLSRHEERWREEMEEGQLILVCDVGGGTTDFTVVAVRRGEKGLRFDRLAVGDHLMLGGDNMDLTLARHLEARLLGQPGTLDSKRWHQLCHQCRKAKEVLLAGESGGGDPPPEKVDITVMGTGGKLIADTLKGTLELSRVEDLILEGFFPFTPLGKEEAPPSKRRSGLTEWGLPYVQDPAVTRHLAGFWQSHGGLLRRETGRDVVYPDFLLFNGGALTPESIRRRLRDVVRSWFREEAGADWQPAELDNPRPELAVAVGAAYYGLVRLGEGVRVGAGSPRAYYVEVASREEGEGEESPEDGKTLTGVCLVPRGTEEGFECRLTQPSFEVLANQPVAFQLFSSSTRLGDGLGEVVELGEDEITVLPPIRTVLRYGRKGAAVSLPVQLVTRLTEVGTLELWCQSLRSSHRWQLQFDVRQEVELPRVASEGETLEAAVIEEARDGIRSVFQGGEGENGQKESRLAPERLMKELASVLEMSKEKWPTSVIRKLADTLLQCERGRGFSPQHEARWLNLLGFCLRPGFGDPLDEWRIKEVWRIFPRGLEFPRKAQGRSEWWIFWRRVAGGLSAGQQWHVYQQSLAFVQPASGKKKKGAKKTQKKLSVQEDLELRMVLANFERLPVDAKVELGDSLLERIKGGKPRPQELWTLSRLGARVPFYGPLDRVVPGEVASRWLDALLNMSLEPVEAAGQAMVQLARSTGDRERDLPAEARDRLAEWLGNLSQGDRLVEVLVNPETLLMGKERDWIFGEALPSGLVLAQRQDPDSR